MKFKSEKQFRPKRDSNPAEPSSQLGAVFSLGVPSWLKAVKALVEHYTGIAEVMGSTPLKALFCFQALMYIMR